MTEKQHVTLPDSLLRAIELLTTDTGATRPNEAYVAAVLITFGYALWTRDQAEFDPTSVQIPDEQWKRICALLTEMPGDSISRVNYALSWMNQGPSAYTPQGEPA